MKFLTRLLAVVAGLTSSWLYAVDSTETAEALQALVARQNTLLAAAAGKTSETELHDLTKDFQTLVHDYKAYLAAHPDVPEAYVTYALLLKQPVIDERRRAAQLFLKANQLFGEASTAVMADPARARHWALVKNELGNYLAEEGRPLDAINYFLSAVELCPDESLYHYQVGNLLAEAREAFLTSGHWNLSMLDRNLQTALARAAELAPDNFMYAFAYAKSFYTVTDPDWDEALMQWRALEERAATPLAKQTAKLHEAKVLLEQGEFAEARACLGTVEEPELQSEKQNLIAETERVPAK